MSETVKMTLIDDAALLKMAEREILGEAKRAAARHLIAGVSGWQPCSKPNKRFLTNTLLQAMASNRILSQRKGNKTSGGKKIERKLLRTSPTEKNCNILYKKPNETANKSVLSASSHKHKLKINKLEQKQSKPPLENKNKYNTKNVKFKNTQTSISLMKYHKIKSSPI